MYTVLGIVWRLFVVCTLLTFDLEFYLLSIAWEIIYYRNPTFSKSSISFPDWLATKNYDIKFECLAEGRLSSLLREFFASVRTKQGKPYSKSAMVSLRSGLNRHLQLPPYNRNINIMRDSMFSTANQVFTGQVKKNREEGAKPEPYNPITPADLDQIYDHYFLPNIENPDTLQHKVFFDLMRYMKKLGQGRGVLRDLRKDSFCVGQLADGTEFVRTLTDSSASEVDQSEEAYDPDYCMLAQGGPRCPVASFKKYISMLHPACEWFFQRPNTQYSTIFFNKDTNSECYVPYLSSAIGKNILSQLMKEISKRAGLQTIYKNGSIKKTAL